MTGGGFVMSPRLDRSIPSLALGAIVLLALALARPAAAIVAAGQTAPEAAALANPGQSCSVSCNTGFFPCCNISDGQAFCECIDLNASPRPSCQAGGPNAASCGIGVTATQDETFQQFQERAPS
jgi:hypothetical protein